MRVYVRVCAYDRYVSEKDWSNSGQEAIARAGNVIDEGRERRLGGKEGRGRVSSVFLGRDVGLAALHLISILVLGDVLAYSCFRFGLCLPSP